MMNVRPTPTTSSNPGVGICHEVYLRHWWHISHSIRQSFLLLQHVFLILGQQSLTVHQLFLYTYKYNISLFSLHLTKFWKCIHLLGDLCIFLLFLSSQILIENIPEYVILYHLFLYYGLFLLQWLRYIMHFNVGLCEYKQTQNSAKINFRIFGPKITYYP